MRPAIGLRNIIRIGQQGFLIRIIPLQGHFNADTVFPGRFKMKDLTQNRFIVIQIFNKGADTAFVLKRFCSPCSFIR